jgi:hypothetical protein
MKKIPPKKLKLHILGLGEVFLERVFYFLGVTLFLKEIGFLSFFDLDKRIKNVNI